MGMFDYVRSSYNLGEQFTNVECHTKDMCKGYGIGGTMSQYWLDPRGHLYTMTYDGTHDFQIIEEDDPRYDKNCLWCNHEWIPTGKHGKVKPHRITEYVEVYPATWKGSWEDWPSVVLHFVEGKLIDFHEKVNKWQK